jgi:hypothetical protein
MTALSPFTPEERFESIKAGLTAAVAGLLWAVMSWLGELTYGISVDGFTGGIRVAIATASTFLFGATYRYVLRRDRNPHLKSGVVTAFILVRVMAQLEVSMPDLSELTWASGLPYLWLLVQSTFLFLAAQWVLDLGLRQGWLKPFGPA